MSTGTFLEHVCLTVSCPGQNREGQVWVGADVPSVREEAGCFLWVYNSPWLLDVVQAHGMFVVSPVDVLAVEVANVQTGVWERRNGRWCESQTWRFVDFNDLVSCNIYAQPLSL